MLAKKSVRVKIVVLALVALLLWPSGAFAVTHHAIQDPLIAASSTVATQSDPFNRGDISRKWLAPGPITRGSGYA